jgi:membrane protein
VTKLHRVIKRLNKYQQQHHIPSFTYGVLKKYSEDRAGQQAALLTYYGFLSLFPLILVLITVTNSLIGRHSTLGIHILNGLTSYFPVLGSQLSSHVHGLHVSGLALLSGIAFSLYGSKGVANVFRRGVQNVWMVPEHQQATFPKSQLKSLTIVIIGGLGFILAALLSGIASAAGHGLAFRLLSIAINLIILFWLFTFLLNFNLPRRVSIKDTRIGAATAAVSLLVLQSLGGYILAHELKKLSALYSSFAITLGLLFWIYLQAKVLYYCLEISVVSSQKLWPRSLESDSPTDVDTHLFNLKKEDRLATKL